MAEQCYGVWQWSLVDFDQYLTYDRVSAGLKVEHTVQKRSLRPTASGYKKGGFQRGLRGLCALVRD